jgi:putative transposase
MIKTFKYKLYKSKRNKKLKSLILLSCEIYNHCISLHKRYYKMYHKTLDKNSLQKHYNNLNSQSIQEITDRIQRSYTLFFNSLKTKNKRKIKLPGFKSSRKYKSFTLKQSGYKLEDNIITIGKLNFKYFKSRELEGKIKTITIKRDSLGDIYLFFVCEVGNPRLRLMTGKTAGFDFGLKTYLTSNEGAKIESPQFLKQDKQFLKLLSRRVSKKKKGSNNKRKSIKNLNRFYRKLVNKRRDFHFKLSKQLTDQYDELYFESLNIKTMQQIWGRKISDLSFSEFMSILENYCIKTGVKLIKIGRWEATSKTCNNCGYKKDDLTLEDRIWTCPSCKTLHDRDINAAKNIFLVGTSTSKGEEVRLSELTKVSSVKHSSLSL